MHRILRTLFWGVVVLAFAWFIASLPGRISIDIGPYTVETSSSLAVTALLLLFIVLYVLVRLVLLVVFIPRAGSLWRGGRRRRAGDLAVTRALVALAAGEKADARREANRARALLGDTPQTLLLAAEAGRLSGRDDEATAAFQALAARKDAAFLGLRGLLANAITQQKWSDAAVLARQAEAAHPGAAWLRQERAQLAIRSGDWAEALALAGTGASNGATGTSPVAALATGAALAETNPDRADRLARQALKSDPSFTPAVIARAGLLRARGREKNALAVLAEGWKRAPHPDIAAMALAPATDKMARVKAAQQLTAGLPEHPESRLLLARTTLDAGVVGEARRHLEAVKNSGLNQRRAWLMHAELEEEERGDTEAGRLAQRDALRKAAAADPDPEWRCSVCHTPQTAWRAACPVCLTPGGLVWGPPAASSTAVVVGGLPEPSGPGPQAITQAA
ncbi:MAG: heme biosynthesis HemY N-terminal domain-containing protein [Acetobacteraceae bacterium]|jgi:HemY protein